MLHFGRTDPQGQHFHHKGVDSLGIKEDTSPKNGNRQHGDSSRNDPGHALAAG